MQIKSFEFQKVKLDVITHELEVKSQRLNGRMIIDASADHATFVSNLPRGVRSREVGRTSHARYVRRNDGKYTITIRCEGDEKYLKEVLINEIREISKKITDDFKEYKNANG